MATRQERRARQRALKRRQRTLKQRGLPPERDGEAIAALAGMLRAALADTARPARVLEAAKLQHEIYETSIRLHPPRAPIDCTRGCAYCCHNFVSVSAPEAFLISSWLDGSRQAIGPEATGSVATGSVAIDAKAWHERAALTSGLSGEERFGKRLPCAFLQDGLCSIYEHRPLACRSCVSFSLDACRQSFEGVDIEIDTPAEAIMLRSSGNFAMFAALRSLGRPFEGYELSEAVTRILDTADALARWSAGEDILAGVQTAGSWTPSLDRALADIAERIAE